MAMGKKKGLSREEAAELYSDLQKTLSKMRNGEMPMKGKAKSGKDASAAKQIAAEISKAMSRENAAAGPASMMMSEMPTYDIPRAPGMKGAVTAVAFVVALGVLRVTLSALEAFGIMGATPVQASMQTASVQPFGKEELKVLTSLDARRAELNQKSKTIEDRANELDMRDREYVVKVTQLKELTDKLRLEREKSEKKRSAQVEQLANVYSSMSPQEAAQLMEQLDVTIALQLMEKMPEKKIGQILAMMSKERALMLTKMMSAR